MAAFYDKGVFEMILCFTPARKWQSIFLVLHSVQDFTPVWENIFYFPVRRILKNHSVVPQLTRQVISRTILVYFSFCFPFCLSLILHFYPIEPYIQRLSTFFDVISLLFLIIWYYKFPKSPRRTRVTLSRSHIRKHKAAGNRRFTGKRQGDKPGNQLVLTRFTRPSSTMRFIINPQTLGGERCSRRGSSNCSLGSCVENKSYIPNIPTYSAMSKTTRHSRVKTVFFLNYPWLPRMIVGGKTREKQEFSWNRNLSDRRKQSKQVLRSD